MTKALTWTEEEVAAFRAQWVEVPATDTTYFPEGSWPKCIVARCRNRCSLRLLSKMCHPHTFKMREQGESNDKRTNTPKSQAVPG